jgi:hypothetical protein
MIRHSKAAPLTIKADDPSYVVASSAFTKVSFALDHLSRTRILHFRAKPDAMDRLLDKLRSPAPLLESLRLCVPNYTNAFIILQEDAFDNTTPRLRQVELSQCRFSWDTPLLSALTHLALHHVNITPTMDQLLSVLRKMPLLQTLILVGSCPVSNSAAERVVTLSQLSNLELSSPVLRCANLLNHISHPPNARLKLKCASDTSAYLDLSSLYPTLGRTRGGSDGTMQLQTLVVELSSGPSRIRGWDMLIDPICMPTTLPVIDITWYCYISRPPGVEITADAVCKVLHITQLQSLHVEITDFPEKIGLETFVGLTKLHMLRVSGPLESSLISALSVGPESDPMNGNPRVRFPRLRTIVLEGMRFSEEHSLKPSLLHLLEDRLIARYEYGVPLESIDIRNCFFIEEQDVEKLREIVVDVRWDSV